MFEHPNDRAVVFKGLGSTKAVGKSVDYPERKCNQKMWVSKGKVAAGKMGLNGSWRVSYLAISVAAMVLTIVDLVDDGNE